MIPLLPRPRIAPSLLLDLLAGVLDSRVSFTRASGGFAFNASGTLQAAAANEPRFDWQPTTLEPLGLLMEGQRTNAMRNPRAEGLTQGAIGAGGVLPTNWTRINSGPAGLTTTVEGTFNVRGIPVLRLRVSGTPASTSTISLSPEPAIQVAALTGQTWTWSFYLALQAGTLDNAQINSRVVSRTSGGGAAGGVPIQVGPSITPTSVLTETRVVQVSTLTGDASTAVVQADMSVSFTAGQPVDLTLDIGAPQLERGSFATSPMLPPAGSPASVTRADDAMLIADVSALLAPAAGAIGIDFDGAFADAGFSYGVFALDNGSSANAIRAVAAAATTMTFAVTVGGVASWSRTGPTLVPASRNTFVASWGMASGRRSVNGGAASSDSGALPTSALRLLLGCGSDGSVAPLFGHLRRVRAWPVSLSPEQMIAEQST